MLAQWLLAGVMIIDIYILSAPKTFSYPSRGNPVHHVRQKIRLVKPALMCPCVMKDSQGRGKEATGDT